MINGLLLTSQQLSQKYEELNAQNFKFPYFYKIKKDNQRLFFIGPHHSFVKNDQLEAVDDYWRKFLAETAGKNCIILIEGGKRQVESSSEVAISKHGEAGYITYLANQKNIPVFSPEPDPKYEAEELLKKFSKEDIEYYYFARMVLQWNKLSPKPDFNKYVGSSLNKDQEKSGWKDFDFSIENLIKIHDQKFEHKFDLQSCERCVYNTSNPITNPVSSACGQLRNKNIVTEIEKLWKEGKNIFIVYGSGHAIVCEPALRKLLI